MIHIADLFCGAGGTSTGAVEAFEAQGKRVHLTAINHWDVAIATHTENHPSARHLSTSIDNIDPRKLFKPGELDLLWASPECTHHSVARGGKPINDQSRATAWCVTRWAEALQPPIVLVENVPEFQTWGPIGTNGRPLKKRKGELFRAWINTLKAAGYTVDWRVLRAADYGDPTTRRRLFVQAVRGKRKIVWPDATHTGSELPELFRKHRPWATARDSVIDWTIPGRSVYDRKRPLSEKTMRRIYAGLEKFGLKPFIVPQQSNPTPKDVDQPLPTVVAEGSGAKLVEPFIITMEHAGSVRSADRPLPTVTTAKGGAMAVAQPFLIPQHGGHPARSVDTPAPTVTTTSRGVGLAEPFIVRLQNNGAADDVAKPLGTVLAGGTHFGLAEPFLIHTAHGNDRRAMEVSEPLPAVAGNRGDVALVEPSLLPQNQGGILRPVSKPVPTIATDGAIALVEPFLVNYYGTGHADSVDEPLAAVTTKDRHGLVRPVVTIKGEKYLLDVRFRMLQPHELAAAQGFRADYKFTGNKSEQVKQIGNAVPRRLARAIVAAVTTQSADVSWILEREEKEAAA